MAKTQDFKIITEVMNAKVRRENQGLETVMSKQGYGTRNENGKLLIEYWLNKNMMIGGTVFPHNIF